MTQRRHVSLGRTAALLAVTALLVGACAPAATPTPPPATPTPPAPTPTPEAQVEWTATLDLFPQLTPKAGTETVDTTRYRTDAPFTIGFSDWGLVNSHRVQSRAAAEFVAEAHGVDLRITDAGLDVAKQIADIEDLLVAGVDALIVAPAVAGALGPVVERAYNAGIPVIIWQSTAGTDKFTSFIYADDMWFGVTGMEKLAADMGGRGNLIVLRGTAGNPVEIARYEGMASVVERFPDIRIVGEEFGDWNEDRGKAITEVFLAAHPQIDGVWSSGAAMTKGAISAFKEAGRPLPPMSGEHLNGFLKLWIEEGLRSSGPVYPSWMAGEAVKLAIKALRGEPVAREYLILAPAIEDATEWVRPHLHDDYWVEGYLTDAQVMETFPN